MTAPALSDVLGFAPRNETEATLISFLQDPDLAITDWNSGGIMRTLLELETENIDDLITATLPLILGEGFVDASDGDWTTAIARGLYGIDRRLGTVATQTVTLACTASAGPYTFTAGTQVFLGSDGKRWIAASGGTLSPSGTLTLDVSGESPGALRGLVNRLESALAGVSVVSSAVKVITGVSQFGSDDESDDALIARCVARWPDLAAIPEMDRVEVWARAASSEVTRVRPDDDPVNPGGVIVTVAGASGAISGGAVTAVQNYILARDAITDYTTVQNASNLTITAAGTATVPTAALPEIKAAADAAWIGYLGATQIGATVYLAKLLQSIMDAGALDVSGLQLNGSAADVTLGTNQVPVPDGAGLASLITWVGV